MQIRCSYCTSRHLEVYSLYPNYRVAEKNQIIQMDIFPLLLFEASFIQKEAILFLFF